jgi:serine/threonine protein kinase
MSVAMAPSGPIPTEAYALFALGELTKAAVLDLYIAPQGSLFPTHTDATGFTELAGALREMEWSDAEAAKLLAAYKQVSNAGREIPPQLLTRWVLAHPKSGAADSVIDCIEIEPPDEVDIIRALPRKGSQKIVFLASWRLKQREVILKKVIGAPESVARILAREELPHPLTLAHPNIIETHRLKNRRSEVFLVEQRLPDVLDDDWPSKGVHEAANLLYDIAKATKYLHDNQLVHGDIKPDNIGRRGDTYVLLDFGICRLAAEFTPETTPTGSLRTRPPELLIEGSYIDPYMVDVWALAATVYNAYLHRFPLINRDDSIPHVSDVENRARFEGVLASRARDEWDKWVDLSGAADPLRGILADMLRADPRQRISAAMVVKRCNEELAAFLRSPERDDPSGTGKFSALDEFAQISSYLASDRVRRLIPATRRQQLRVRLTELKRMAGFDEGARETIDDLLAKLA